jgi:hypothetical protein
MPPPRPHRRRYHVLLEFGAPLTARHLDALTHDAQPPPHPVTGWWPAPGPAVTSGVLVVRARDAVAAGTVAAGTCLALLGGLGYHVTAVMPDTMTWPPPWYSPRRARHAPRRP